MREPDLDEPLFPSPVAARAAGLPAGTLLQWMSRHRDELRLWEPKGEVTSGGGKASTGGAHLLTLRTVLHIAATARLKARGLTVGDAYRATLAWTHMGSGGGGFIGTDDSAPLPIAGRAPAALYLPPDLTLLVHHSGPSATVVRANVTTSGGLTMLPDALLSRDPLVSPTIINLNTLDEQVRGVCRDYLEGNG